MVWRVDSLDPSHFQSENISVQLGFFEMGLKLPPFGWVNLTCCISERLLFQFIQNITTLHSSL
jgi:hypothetical protein